MVIGWLINMASAKQIAWRKKFAKMAKSGDFRKGKNKTGAKETAESKAREIDKIGAKIDKLEKELRDLSESRNFTDMAKFERLYAKKHTLIDKFAKVKASKPLQN